MPSLIDLRRRIRSVKNTQQITKAMKMVSAAKLRRAQDAVTDSRPYSDLLREILTSVLGHSSDVGVSHPLLAEREAKRVLVLLLSGDKGLAGAFNANIFKEARQFFPTLKGSEIELELIGKKGRDHYKRRDFAVSGEWVNVFSKVELATAREISAKVIERFSNAEVDAVYLLYSKFVSAMSQKPTVQRLLPFVAPEGGGETATEYIYEQPPERIFAATLPRYVDVQVYQAMLESAASEHSARMAAMDAATRNAGEMIEDLTLHLNRVRQASITTEIIEVVSGAAALG